MMRFTAPTVNPAFEAKVRAEREKVRAEIAAGKHPKIDKKLWADFKADFSAAQHGRCAYCEISVTAGHAGDVEHYRPKNALAEFGRNWEGEQGKETKDLAKVRGRSPSRRWPSGYWWLAYDWSNYLLSCEVCNRVWKGNLFPIRRPPHRSGPPAENSVKEVPLLLNPYGSRDPARHLQFNKDGSVEPRKNSTFGRETIRTCGLHRQAITTYRSQAARDAFAAVIDARKQARAGVAPENNSGFQSLHRMGSEDAQYFPGVVRAIIFQQLGPVVTWELLDELLSDRRR